jgi:colanic acid biosynthesis protein WcaH
MTDKLPDAIFREIVQHTPLIAIDLCIVDSVQQILLGYRNNRPARDSWFVPGGRIRKGEALVEAFSRIAQQELGMSLTFDQGIFLGSYEHFYPDNFFDDSFGTHYVVLAYAVYLNNIRLEGLPAEQHNNYRLATLAEFESDQTIHENSRAYAHALKNQPR